MKLPLITKSSRAYFPRNNKCPVCSKFIGEPGSFVCINGGAMIETEKRVFEMDDKLSGFLDISFHGAHDMGVGVHRGKYLTKEIVSHSVGGQFDIYFCSIPCTKKFINAILDEMENELKNKSKITKTKK